MGMSHFADTLTAQVKDTSPVCLEIAPQLGLLPKEFPQTVDGVMGYCRGLLEAAEGSACAVSIQLSSFEVLGWQGMKAFWELAKEAKAKGFVVIADGKRGDLAEASGSYADAYLHAGSPVDALTVHPYFGSDSIAPFIERAVANGKGIFVTVKTSNTGAGDLQDLPAGDEAVHENLAQIVESWGMHHIGPETSLSCVGAIVGTLYPEELKYLRTIMPHLPFLLPFEGSEDFDAKSLHYGFLPDGTGAIVSIRPTAQSTTWQTETREQIVRLREALHG